MGEVTSKRRPPRPPTPSRATSALPDGQRISYRVGALARLNCADRIDTPLAGAEFERFREVGGFPCHQTVMYHYARLVEMLYAAEKLAELVRDPAILSDDVRNLPSGTPRRASAHVEAPRGILIHDYDVDLQASSPAPT